MGRQLNTTVQAGPYVYPAGTDESEIDAGFIDGIGSHLWDDGTPAVQETGGGADVERVRVLEALGDDLRKEIVDLTEARDNAVAELEAERAVVPPPGDVEVSLYADLDVDALKAKIDERNEGRDDDAKISKRGGKDTLIGFLTADDALIAGA